MIKEGFSGLKTFFFQSRKMNLFFIWVIFIVFLLFAWVIGESSNDRTVAVSALVCGGSTFLFWSYKKRISIKSSLSPRVKFVLIGGLGAVWAEFVFWFFEKVFGASGVAASPVLALDLLVTMPWYIMMLFLLFKVETKYHYSYTEILLLGGLYELGADGIFGQVLEGLTLSGLFLVVMVVPLFVIVYSIMVLPPSYLLRDEINRIRETTPQGTHKYRYALLPLLGLIPYFLMGFLVLMGSG
jgi:hypothetical protein